MYEYKVYGFYIAHFTIWELIQNISIHTIFVTNYRHHTEELVRAGIKFRLFIDDI